MDNRSKIQSIITIEASFGTQEFYRKLFDSNRNPQKKNPGIQNGPESYSTVFNQRK